jgi:hypothetical protein
MDKTRTNLINFTYLARRKLTGCQHRYWTLDELHDSFLNNKNMLLVDLVHQLVTQGFNCNVRTIKRLTK